MGPKTAELCSVLRETAEILNQDGQTGWSNWINEALLRIENSDYSGIEFLQSGFGGMGSFDDTYVNERFDYLRGRIHDLVFYIRRNAEITG